MNIEYENLTHENAKALLEKLIDLCSEAKKAKITLTLEREKAGRVDLVIDGSGEKSKIRLDQKNIGAPFVISETNIVHKSEVGNKSLMKAAFGEVSLKELQPYITEAGAKKEGQAEDPGRSVSTSLHKITDEEEAADPEGEEAAA
jgi:hypothetical protein